MKNMKNKNLLIGIGAVVVVLLVVIGFFVISGQKKSAVNMPQKSAEEETLTMKPEEIGLVLKAMPGNKEVEMIINDLSKIKSFEYDMNYDAVVNGETVSQGATGSGDVKATDTSIDRKITIGTCSKNVCRYDQGVKKVTFVIRLNLKDGKTAVVQQDLNLQ